MAEGKGQRTRICHGAREKAGCSHCRGGARAIDLVNKRWSSAFALGFGPFTSDSQAAMMRQASAKAGPGFRGYDTPRWSKSFE
jgi:hypothetical protein